MRSAQEQAKNPVLGGLAVCIPKPSLGRVVDEYMAAKKNTLRLAGARRVPDGRMKRLCAKPLARGPPSAKNGPHIERQRPA